MIKRRKQCDYYSPLFKPGKVIRLEKNIATGHNEMAAVIHMTTSG